MIQFNLLPDVKQEFQKAQAAKRSAILIATIVAGSCLAIALILASVVYVGQKTHLHGLDGDIAKYKQELAGTADLTKVLTVQNQLNSLTCSAQELKEGKKPCLHDKKPVSTRLFGYMGQIVPANISIAKLDIKFEDKTISFTGTAPDLGTINRFVDTLKFTTYTSPQVDEQNKGKTGNDVKLPRAFNSVVLSAFTRNEKDSTYTVDLVFDQTIFDSSQDTKLVVPPGAITTRSTTEKPSDLFQPTSKPAK